MAAPARRISPSGPAEFSTGRKSARPVPLGALLAQPILRAALLANLIVPTTARRFVVGCHGRMTEA